MKEVMAGIRGCGEIAFLHAREDNVRAIQLYERLGFKQRKLGHFAVLRKTG
jgi:ribosomal protein S18 acetylase RimI-like enzyme